MNKPSNLRPGRPRLTGLAGLAGTSLLALLLGGCTIVVNRYYPAPADPANPLVLVRDGRVSVSAEPLRFSRKDGAVTITWRLPAGGPFSFAEDGIVVTAAAGGDGKRSAKAAAEEFSCQRAKPTEYSCLNRNSGPGVYKYTVRVTDNGKPLDPLDPFIINDW